MTIATKPVLPARTDEYVDLSPAFAGVDQVVVVTDGRDGRVAHAIVAPYALRLSRARELLELPGVERLEVVPIREVRDITRLVRGGGR